MNGIPMIVPPAINRYYRNIESILNDSKQRLDEIVRPFCEARAYPYLSRIKAVESLAEKIEGGRYKRFADVNDLVACCIVIPSLADEDDTIAFLEANFSVASFRLRNEAKKPADSFRFDSTRYYVRLHPGPSLGPPEFGTVQMEVQIRSAFEHAWIVATHSLVYKGRGVSWKRLRLAAQLKASVEQLDMLILGYDEVTKNVGDGVWLETKAQAMVCDRIRAISEEGSIPKEMVPKDWTRFSSNFLAFLKAARGKEFRQNPTSETEKACKLIESYIKNKGGHALPRSISLLQLALGVLTDSEYNCGRTPDYVFPLSREMADEFPAVTAIKNAFEFSDR